MRQGWTVGVIFLWLSINFVEMQMTGATQFAPVIQTTMNMLWRIDLTNFAGALTAIVSIINNTGAFFKEIIQIVFLWSPTVFEGNFYWLWLFFCFPIAVGFIISIIVVIRGVSSN